MRERRMSDPCDLKIERVSNVGEGTIVAIEARDGMRVLARIELSEKDFVAATLSGSIVGAGITMRNLP
jgi:hypothetical protein